MKTLILLLLSSLLAFSSFSQEEPKLKEQEKESSSETKSFTLDANDAVLEEKVVDVEPEIDKPNVPATTLWKNDFIERIGDGEKHAHNSQRKIL